MVGPRTQSSLILAHAGLGWRMLYRMKHKLIHNNDGLAAQSIEILEGQNKILALLQGQAKSG